MRFLARVQTQIYFRRLCDRVDYRRAPRRLAKLDLLLAGEGGSEIYLSLLRDPNTEFVKELLREGGTEFGIEEIGAEGRVELLSYSEMTCQTASGGSLVTGTIRNSADYYYELVLSNGEQFRVTAKHPIWVETKQDSVSAEKLSLGDQVRLYADTFATVASLRRVDSPLDVFNIEVENEHVYYVGVDGMLVHNANGGMITRQPEVTVREKTERETTNLRSGREHTPTSDMREMH